MDARAEVRHALIGLHKELLAAQRVEMERFSGRMTAAEALQAAADDLRFSWIREVSELIAALDETHAAAQREGSPPDTARVMERARELFDPPDPATAFGSRYLRALQDHPDVVLAHRDLMAALAR